MKLLLIYIFLDVRALAADNLCIRMDLFSLLSFPFSFGKSQTVSLREMPDCLELSE